MKSKIGSYINKRFGRLLVIKEKNRLKLKTYCFCQCDCGNKKWIYKYSLGKYTESCGCIHKEKHTKHGMSGTRPHRIWQDMKQRCCAKNRKGWENYGGRGITVCDRWKNSFVNFWEDMKEGYKDNLEIDRIDTNKGYFKKNCRWATREEQCNNMRKNIWLYVDGKKQTISQYAKEKNIKYDVARWKLRKHPELFI